MRKTRPCAGRGVELDPAAERAHRLADDREAEPEAVGVALAAVEAVEDVALHLAADAGAGVLDLERHRVAGRATRGGRREPRVGVLRRVLAEVPQRLLEQVAVRLHREPVGALHRRP